MEKAHDISIDEPCVAHQAILFMLDVLMRNNKPTLSLADLYDSFGDKSFTPQMLRAVGGNEQGLKQFLLRYPSLFTVNGDQISANSGGNQLPRTSSTPERYLRKPNKSKSGTGDGLNGSTNGDGMSCSSTNGDLASSSTSATGSNGLNGSSTSEHLSESKTMKEIEQEATAFFRKQISKREEDWLPIVSVAGHASQSSADVRKFVGPQNEFKSFLLKYPHIFVVREEYCGLKGKADVSAAPFPPPSPPPKRRQASTISMAVANSSIASTLSRNHSFKQANRYSTCNLIPNSSNIGLINASSSSILNQSNASTPTSMMSTNSIANSLASASNGPNNNGMQKPRLTPVEVKAVHYVMRILHKNGRMLLQTIPGLISRAPDQVSNIVGFTREDLIQFFKRHSAIFQLHPDGCVSVKQDAVKALILKDASLSSSTNCGLGGGLSSVNLANNSTPDCAGIITNNGVVLRIFPKYGILNMDNNEQVFFDIQSCQFETFSDLTTILHTGDRLHFNAVIGPRDGSTKWRSIKTWIKMKPQQTNGNGVISMLDNLSSHSDADKSDDSSTSSLGGYNGGASNGHRHNGTNSYLNNQQQFAFNQAQQQQVNGASSSGSHYYNSGATSPTSASQSILPLAPSPTGAVVVINGSGIISGSSSSTSYMVNGTGLTNGTPATTPSAPGSTPPSAMHQSISGTNLEGELNNAAATNGVIFGMTGNSSSTIGLVGVNGDFNQYQLLESSAGDSSVTLSGAVNQGEDSADGVSASNSNYLIHSSSASNLQLNKMNTSLINSKSIHSFNSTSSAPHDQTQISPTTSTALIEQHIASMQLNTSANNQVKKIIEESKNAASTVTKFMKQAPDNISQREVVVVTVPPTRPETIEMVSIGCQTISTGDITVTNVYIE